jgi:very long chain acyl-CoA dehydrogenase
VADDRKTKDAPKPTNHSFVHNLFRGQVDSSEVFPFPIALNEEQTEYIGSFVDPVSKFFAEVNDPIKNDANAVS